MNNRVSGPSFIAGIIFILIGYLLFSFIYLDFNYNDWYWSGKILFTIWCVFNVVQMFESSNTDNSKNGE